MTSTNDQDVIDECALLLRTDHEDHEDYIRSLQLSKDPYAIPFLETVIDSTSKKPLEGAFVYDRLEGQTPGILARSNERGEIRLDPKRKFIVSGLLGEAMVLKVIWVCKEGYTPYLAAFLRGWNSDFGPSTIHTPKVIELLRSPLASTESCLDLQH